MKSFLASLACMFAMVCTAQTSTSDAWINEFHYDENTTYGNADANEFVEVAMRTVYAANPTELAKYKIVLYTSGALDTIGFNSGKGLPYHISSSWYTEQETVHPLTTFTICEVPGAPQFVLLSKPLPILQDVPAAIALVYENTVVQLLSYEKVFKIETLARGGGAAAEQTTTLVTRGNTSEPAMETAGTPANHSISLMGAGATYSSFQWDDGPLVMATPCAPNTDGINTQIFLSPLPVRFITLAATGIKNTIYVQWKVAPGSNAVSYQVELALANGAFGKAVEIPADAGINGSFQTHLTNMPPGMYTVRVKSILNTGAFEYSEGRLVKLAAGQASLVNVYPNPVKDGRLQVFISPANRQAFNLQLVSATGKLVQVRQTGVLEAGSSNNVTINIAGLHPGVYYLQLLGASQRQTVKVVIAR